MRAKREVSHLGNNLFSIIFSAIKAKIMPLWIKIRLWTSPAFFRGQVLNKIRAFFTKLLDVKPRNRKDYYPMLRWLVSKRLAFALVVILGIGATFYIVIMLPSSGGDRAEESIPAYQYRSIPLKFHSGTAQILARDGHLAYVGQVDKGSCVGKGTLYGGEGELVYDGQFADNRFNGSGTLYYPSGGIQYTGSFTDNLFHGVGAYYRPSGSPEYEGDHVAGTRTGQGKLYNGTGRQIFEGSFLNNAIVYQDFLDKPTRQVTELYSGTTAIYDSGEEYCVSMPEIQAVYAVKDGSNTLENEWIVTSVYVLESAIPLDGESYTSISQLQAVLGQPLYFGTAWVDLPEAVALNLLAQSNPEAVGTVEMQTHSALDNVFSVTGYDRDFQVYLYTFQRDDLLYTFYCTGPGVPGFVMYAIEGAGSRK